MSVDTERYRRHMRDFEELWGTTHTLKATMGVRGSDLLDLLTVYELAIAYATSEHTSDSNCSAGDHDDCSARDRLARLEAYIGGPRRKR